MQSRAKLIEVEKPDSHSVAGRSQVIELEGMVDRYPVVEVEVGEG